MKDYQVGDLLIGTVTSVRPYAIFMDFDEETCGLLHISEISDAFVRDIERFAYEGDQIKVKVISVDPLNGFLRVSLKKVPEKERFSTHRNTYRKRIETTNEDFKPLQDNLDEWIKYTLKKKEENND